VEEALKISVDTNFCNKIRHYIVLNIRFVVCLKVLCQMRKLCVIMIMNGDLGGISINRLWPI
jgi:hypothetical protein